MEMTSALLAMAVLGFQWGYQEADDGTVEYLIQLRPEEALHLADSPNAEITSYVPAAAQPVGRIRITVGTGPVPRGDASADTTAAGAAPRLTESQLTETQLTGTQLTETQLRIPPEELEKDLAGKLVPIPGRTGSTEIAERETPQGQMSPPNGVSPQATTPDAQPRTVQSPQPWPRDGVTHPVYNAEEPANEIPEVDLTSLDFPERPNSEDPATDDPSPSDRNDTTAARETAEASEDAADRPWLALVGAIALACGFLAGNIFQWRSYQSLRKRYLHLLRKTGG